MLKLLDIAGNHNVGVFVRASERHAFVPETASKREVADVEEALAVPATKLSLGGSHVVGSLLAANSKGAVVADIAFNIEVKKIEKAGLKVKRLDELLNAAGNNILCNDHGALVNPEYTDAAVKTVQAALGVPVARGTLGENGIVGMCGIATNKGVLVHAKSTPEEREVARRILGVDVMLGTINHGSAQIGAGMAANTKGAVIGTASTGVELNRIEDALGFLGNEPPA